MGGMKKSEQRFVGCVSSNGFPLRASQSLSWKHTQTLLLRLISVVHFGQSSGEIEESVIQDGGNWVKQKNASEKKMKREIL